MTHNECRERRSRIAQAVADGHSVNAVARQFRVSLTTVYGACSEHGVVARRPKHDPTRPPRLSPFVILARLMAEGTGAGYAEVARGLGISRQRVCQVAHEARLAGVPGLPASATARSPKGARASPAPT